ncbi:serine hydrolase [Paraglaciecola aestuariivivens]
MKTHTLTLFLAALLLVSQLAFANPKFDRLMNELVEDNGPGAAALVVKNGQVLYRKALGKANLELNLDLQPDNVFRIGSITKQFTAVAILKLAEQGKLDLNADITRYIKDYPTGGHTITVQQLLNHTSGIKSYTSMASWDAEARKKQLTPLQLIELFKHEPLEFAPGEQFKYNNSGYVLLGYIIELVSGESYPDYIKNHIFKPLNMHNSYYGSNAQIIKNRASGYEKDEQRLKNADYLSMTQPYAAGSLLSTVDDIHTWYQAVMTDKVITAKSRSLAHQMGQLNNGKSIDYGLGWFIGNIQGSKAIEHGGGINGFLSASIYLPEEKVFVAILSNCNCIAPGTTASKMAAIAIDKPYEWEKIVLSDSELKSYQGVYERTADDLRTFTFEDGQLYSLRSGGARFKIHPFGKDQFFFEDGIVSLEFNRNKKGKLISVSLKSTKQDQVWVKTDKPIPSFSSIDLDPKVFATFVGSYELAPKFHIKIFSENNKMFAQATGQKQAELIALSANQLMLKNSDIKMTFNHNQSGDIESLTLHQNGEHLAKKIN